VSLFCTGLLCPACAYVLWRASATVCRRLNLAAVRMVLGFFGLVAGLFATAASA
jgi:hypothetical protein